MTKTLTEFLLHKLNSINEFDSLEEIDINTIAKCISMLKPFKAAGLDGISPEYLIHASLALHFKQLFTIMLVHSYVPDSFSKGIIIPIIKDKRGDASSLDNYRSISLGPAVSKVFEAYIIDRFAKYFYTDPLQFRFRKQTGSSEALFALQQAINYFNQRDSNIYLASLDACKAFDQLTILNYFQAYMRESVLYY